MGRYIQALHWFIHNVDLSLSIEYKQTPGEMQGINSLNIIAMNIGTRGRHALLFLSYNRVRPFGAAIITVLLMANETQFKNGWPSEPDFSLLVELFTKYSKM